MKMTELEEFLVLHSQPSTSGLIYWTHNQTLSLIDGYKKHRNRVGTLEMRSMKRMWEIISNEINLTHKTNFSGNHCENRWRVIERNYKKYIDDSNKTGRGRKIFEYSAEMDDIFGKKKNINPELLLSSETIQHDCNIAKDTQCTSDNGKVVENEGETAESEVKTPSTSRTPRRFKLKQSNKNNILEQMRQDKKQFYTSLLKQRQDKLELQKEKFANDAEFKKQHLLELQRQNELLEKRNLVLDKYLKMKVSLPTGIF